MKLSIKYKLLIIVFSTIIVSLSVFSYLLFSTFQNDKISYIYDRLQIEVEAINNQVSIYFKEYHQFSKEYTLRIGDQFFYSTYEDNDLTKKIEVKKVLDEISTRNNVYFINTNSKIYPKNKLLDNFYKRNKNKIFNKSLLTGVVDFNIDNEEYLISFARVALNVIAVKMYRKDMMFENINMLKQRAIAYFFGILAFSMILMITVTNSLIFPLTTLTSVVKNMTEKQTFIKNDIKTNDEVGTLAQSFNDMGAKTFSLMEEVNSYNYQLEEIVRARTKSLNKTLKYQKALVNVLSQGFLMVSKKMTVSGIYSSSAVEIIGEDPKGKEIFKLLNFNSKDESIKKLFNTLFEEKIPFHSTCELLPKYIYSFSGKFLNIDLEPLRNNSNQIVALVIVLTDVTKQVESDEKYKIEKAYSKMIYNMITNRNILVYTLNLVNDFFAYINNNHISEVERFEVFRYIHSFKAAFYGLSILEIGDFLHKFEVMLKDELSHTELGDIIEHLNLKFPEILDSFFEKEGELIKISSWRNPEDLKYYTTHKIKNYYSHIMGEYSQNKIACVEFKKQFMMSKLSSCFNKYEKEVIEIANTSEKAVNHFTYMNDLLIDDDIMENYFFIFEHIFKNMIDHGIESKSERLGIGKSQSGHIQIDLELEDLYYIFTIMDDGRGVNIEKIRSRVIALDVKVDISNDEELLNAIFLPGLSTKERVSNISGRGVGMSAVKEFLESKGGNIKVFSIKDEGTTFKIKIPRNLS